MTDQVIVERNVEATMRDGTILRANVYRPATTERLPVLLQRTPYGKNGAQADFCLLSATRGYAVVVQDTRGRWDSEGTHYPMRDEFADGYDTVEWAASQPWANGRVGMWGGAYVGWTQWAVAAMCPPALKAIFPLVTFTDSYRDVIYPGGALALGVATSWGLGSGVSMAIMRMNIPDAEKQALMEELADVLDGLATGKTFRTLPLTAMPLLSRPEIGFPWADWLAHPDDDAYWAQMNVRRAMGKIAVPAYHLGGWYDIFASGTLANYMEMVRSAATPEARHGQKLIMGPWLHGPMNGVVGEVDFGYRASDASVFHWNILWRWFDYWLKGEQNGIMDEPPVRLFVMGRNRWRNEQEWPLARTAYTPCYLHSAGTANTVQGDGTLSFAAPQAEASDHFTYDPADPVPTRGGGLCCWQAALPAGAFDQREIEARADVLVYTSALLEEELEVTGPLQVTLWAASSAVDTDFTAKLVDVHPCGYARNVAEGIIRARYRHSTQTPTLLTPGAVEEYTIQLGATSNVFLAGHRLRVEISSSSFPQYDRNPNLGHDAARDDELLKAEQVIYHDAQHPSHLLLPIIPA
jgi:hypothetical protein